MVHPDAEKLLILVLKDPQLCSPLIYLNLEMPFFVIIDLCCVLSLFATLRSCLDHGCFLYYVYNHVMFKFLLPVSRSILLRIDDKTGWYITNMITLTWELMPWMLTCYDLWKSTFDSQRVGWEGAWCVPSLHWGPWHKREALPFSTSLALREGSPQPGTLVQECGDIHQWAKGWAKARVSFTVIMWGTFDSESGNVEIWLHFCIIFQMIRSTLLKMITHEGWAAWTSSCLFERSQRIESSVLASINSGCCTR